MGIESATFVSAQVAEMVDDETHVARAVLRGTTCKATLLLYEVERGT